MAHNSLSNTKLVVAGAICLQGASSLMLLTCFGSAGGRTRQSIAAKSHKTQNRATKNRKCTDDVCVLTAELHYSVFVLFVSFCGLGTYFGSDSTMKSNPSHKLQL